MDNSTLILVIVVLLVILLVCQRSTPEHMTLIDRLDIQNQNFDIALREKLRVEEESRNSEQFGDPYADVQKALNRRLEFMCSTANNSEEPLCDALHGGSALSSM